MEHFAIVANTYIHNHECTRKGQTIELRPDCREGVALETVPICIETGNALVFIERKVI